MSFVQGLRRPGKPEDLWADLWAKRSWQREQNIQRPGRRAELGVCGGDAARKLGGGRGLGQRMKREREIDGQPGHGDLTGSSQEGFWLVFQVR